MLAGVYSPKFKSYRFKNKTTVSGKAMITKDLVIIETNQGVETYPRSELVSISKGPPRERTWWANKMINLKNSIAYPWTAAGEKTTQ